MEPKRPHELFSERYASWDTALNEARRRAILAGTSPRQWLWWRNAAAATAAGLSAHRREWVALAAAWLAILALHWAANLERRSAGAAQGLAPVDWHAWASMNAELAAMNGEGMAGKEHSADDL